MAVVDVEIVATHLRKRAAKRSLKICATRVREALEAGGARTKSLHPPHAKDWGPTLLRLGFHEIAVEKPVTFLFMKGDVVVIQPYKGGNASGHIAAYDGKNWISDFVQLDFWSGPGYRQHRPSHVFYRP